LLGLQDIHNLLQEWADEIADCERIWIRASASNRKIFLDYRDDILVKGKYALAVLVHVNKPLAGDERLRTFPFPTRRPVGPLVLCSSLVVLNSSTDSVGAAALSP
jgi:hypothetical protein